MEVLQQKEQNSCLGYKRNVSHTVYAWLHISSLCFIFVTLYMYQHMSDFLKGFFSVIVCDAYDSSAHLNHLCSLSFRHTSSLCRCIVHCCTETDHFHNFL